MTQCLRFATSVCVYFWGNGFRAHIRRLHVGSLTNYPEPSITNYPVPAITNYPVPAITKYSVQAITKYPIPALGVLS